MKFTSILLVILVLITASCDAQPVSADTAYLSVVKTALRAVWPNNRTINIVFHGHSVPVGYRDNHEVHTLESYPMLVLKKLKARYIYAPVNLMITAIGGEDAISGQKRFQEDVLLKKPDVILIDYSLNDRGAGLEKARVAWELMIRQAQQQNIKVILLTPSPDQRVDIMAPNNDLERHAKQVRQLAQQYHTGLVDSFELFQKIVRDGAKISGVMASVNHPNDKGHEIIADEIMKWF